MLDMIAVSKIGPDYKNLISDNDLVFADIRANIDNYLEQEKTKSVSSAEQNEYLLFLNSGKIVGFSYLEGAIDIKNAKAIYQTIGQPTDSKIESEIIGRSTMYAFNELNIIDVYWPTNQNISPFLVAAASQNLDCCCDDGVVIYSRDYQFSPNYSSKK